MRKFQILFLLILLSCGASVEDIQRGSALEKVVTVNVSEFFRLRMQNRIRKANVGNFEILFEDGNYLYFGKPVFSSIFGDKRIVPDLYRVDESALAREFPGFRRIDGVLLRDRLIEEMHRTQPGCAFDTFRSTLAEHWINIQFKCNGETKGSSVSFHIPELDTVPVQALTRDNCEIAVFPETATCAKRIHTSQGEMNYAIYSDANRMTESYYRFQGSPWRTFKVGSHGSQEQEERPLDLDADGVPVVFLVLKDAGSGAETNQLTILAFKYDAVYWLAVHISYDPADLPEIEYSANHTDARARKYFAYLESQKSAYGYLTAREREAKGDTPDLAYYFWRKENRLCYEKKCFMHARYYAQEIPHNHCQLRLSAGSLEYCGEFKGGVIAHELETGRISFLR